MNKNLVVEIFVPTEGGAPDQGVIGTGYPVAKDLILTARHVLRPDDRNPNEPVEIRWRHPRVGNGDWCPCPGELAWESDPASGLDVALLRCAFPQAILAEAWGFLSAERPTDHLSWSGAGFAGAGGRDRNEQRRVVNVQGKVHSAPDADSQFELGVDYATEEEAGWRGISGSAVFVHGRIIGVVVTCPDNFDAERLRATPLWKILGDASFRRTVGYDDQQKRRRQFQQKVARVLEDSAAAMQELTRGLAPALNLAGLSLPDQARSTAARLLDLGVPEVITRCKQVHDELADGDRPDDAKVVVDLIQLLLPAIYDHGVIEAVRTRKYQVDAALIELPAGIRTVAEVIMAGVDRRRTLYREDQERFPEGVYSLPLPPEGGFDGDGEAFRRAWNEHLINKLCPADAETLRCAWDDYMIGRFAAPEPRARQRATRELIELAADELDYRSREQGKTYYFLTDAPAEADARRALAQMIGQLKESYPAVVFLQLNDAHELERSEKRQYRPFCDLVRRETEGER